MSYKTLPLLFINLGGEMVYILDQRLRAQNIPDEKSKKVLHDIIATMYHKRFMEELFKLQPVYSKKAMRTVFDRLAHASIMRLNAASMDKLYDLMTMAFKFQVSLCLRPKDILLITLNHIDAVRSLLDGAPNIRQQVDHVYRVMIETFGSLSLGEFQLIRQTLLNFFQDMHIRVSIFLKDKVQSSNGRFVLPTSGALPYGTDPPGTIRFYDAKGKERSSNSFPVSGNFVPTLLEGSYDIKGDRVTKLGSNMYAVSRPVDTSCSTIPMKSYTSTVSDIDSNVPDPLAKAQLDLLQQLIGSNTEKSEIRLNLFKTDAEEEEAAAAVKPMPMSESKVIRIDASKKQKNDELNKIMGELNVQENSGAGDDDDLLNLMDSAH